MAMLNKLYSRLHAATIDEMFMDLILVVRGIPLQSIPLPSGYSDFL